MSKSIKSLIMKKPERTKIVQGRIKATTHTKAKKILKRYHLNWSTFLDVSIEKALEELK